MLLLKNLTTFIYVGVSDQGYNSWIGSVCDRFPGGLCESPHRAACQSHGSCSCCGHGADGSCCGCDFEYQRRTETVCAGPATSTSILNANVTLPRSFSAAAQR